MSQCTLVIATYASWEVDFEFKTIHPFALIAPSFVKQFEGVLQVALLNLKEQVEQTN